MSYFAVALAVIMSLPQVVYENSALTPIPIAESATTTPTQNITPEAKTKVPEILTKIAQCESSGRHFDSQGNVVVGEINKFDTGKYQINRLYWETEAEKQGFDLTTEDGNEAMALYLYHRFGTAPWNSSKKCWGSQASA